VANETPILVAKSKVELGKREPTFIDLLKYARIAGVNVEVLIDDEINLPESIVKVGR
jgi:hypothetical protein